ncbi:MULTISPECIES: GAF and ANTAR domain-containing protein [Subtercola]|uniref:ANTAR domain-containing protein n=1 Tax=Subtercola vilae TaxID=2056433 RepID=A0A4T2CAH5_9MICO|nr:MULTISPECIES: GAF and ANTAR domain-containing protein [Subtercola]MEA9986816.1 GAF and ANTAR domain-containing protein [Subtercola sp. RTI3]TIH40371.1 ANTAR domain-containing protein [Subtercola vilae]
MTDRAVFSEALEELSRAQRGGGRAVTSADLCGPFLRVLPVTGAAVSTIGSGLGVSTICASDDAAAKIDELQIDLGEGPCWEALSTRRPVIADNFAVEKHPAWPVFAEALRGYRIGALYAFPLTLGALDIGSIDFYSNSARSISKTELDDVTALSEIAAWQVLRRVLADDSQNTRDVDADPSPGFSRKQVHQATGMIIAQLQVPATDAMLLLRAHAFSSGRTVREVAHDVVARRLDFLPASERS